jgi:hypothetical protein
VVIPRSSSALQLLSPTDKVWKKAKSRNARMQKRQGEELWIQQETRT